MSGPLLSTSQLRSIQSMGERGMNTTVLIYAKSAYGEYLLAVLREGRHAFYAT